MAKGLRYLEDAVTLTVDPDACTGCGRCVQVCPHAVFELVEGRVSLRDRGACMECGACKMNCAFGAIEVESGVGCASAILSALFRRSDDVSCDSSGGGCC